MNRRAPTSIARCARGFTLVEVLLALVLLAALLTSINQFVFSITEVWTSHRDEFVFVQHTRAVARHLDEMLQTAANSSHASIPSGGAPAVEEIRLPEGGTEELVAFDLPEGDRLLVWPGRPLPEVQCALGWRKEDGLVLYWKSRLETDFGDAPPRLAVISTFVTSLAYDYYDRANNTWTTEPELQRDEAGNYELPRRLRLHFRRKGHDYEEVIEVPAITEGLPAY
ncbi:MAG TPA: prepilin-type N-terminal cleavage/methylation domain-containing protein [Lacunisphaera sp.]|jgi:prepilin-type N-terminal cleavage/methylation domain-containing protein|nr:prepilin-type N-terminal cleavage/methylation domain-containing protein [Lacunisphaera sp.]